MEYHDKESDLLHFLYEDYEAWLVRQRYNKPQINADKITDFHYTWKLFIESSDFGLNLTEPLERYNIPGAFIYDIVDEKKWLLAKLKYGL